MQDSILVEIALCYIPDNYSSNTHPHRSVTSCDTTGTMNNVMLCLYVHVQTALTLSLCNMGQ